STRGSSRTGDEACRRARGPGRGHDPRAARAGGRGRALARARRPVRRGPDRTAGTPERRAPLRSGHARPRRAGARALRRAHLPRRRRGHGGALARRPDAPRAGDVRHGGCHRRRGEPLLPRRRRPAAAAVVGRDDRRGAALPARGAPPRAVPRPRARGCRAGAPAARRRAARRARRARRGVGPRGDPTVTRAFDVVVVGGGIAGASLAYFLAERGVTDVLLLERESQPGSHATGRSAAVLAELDPISTLQELKVGSAGFLRRPPPGFAETPLLEPSGIMILLREPF